MLHCKSAAYVCSLLCGEAMLHGMTVFAWHFSPLDISAIVMSMSFEQLHLVLCVTTVEMAHPLLGCYFHLALIGCSLVWQENHHLWILGVLSWCCCVLVKLSSSNAVAMWWTVVPWKNSEGCTKLCKAWNTETGQFLSLIWLLVSCC